MKTLLLLLGLCALPSWAVTCSGGEVQGLGATIRTWLGPISCHGDAVNPWPFYDTTATNAVTNAMTNHGDVGSGAFYTPWWRNYKAGTLTLTAGTPLTISASGTSFQSTICNSGTSIRSGAEVSVKYTGTDGRTHFMDIRPTGCPSNTVFTTTYPYTTTPVGTMPDCTGGPVACQGLQYAVTYDGDSEGSRWRYGQAPADYYDSALAYWYQWQRQGSTTARDAYRQLADWQWESPAFDQGNAILFNGNNNIAIRSWSFNSIFLRELEGETSYLTGLRVFIDTASNSIRNLMTGFYTSWGNIYDLRDEAYAQAYLNACALLDTGGGGSSSACLTALGTLSTGLWQAFQSADGGWYAPYYSTGSPTAAGGRGSVTATNGSTSLVLSGATWTSGDAGNAGITCGPKVGGAGNGTCFLLFTATPTSFPAYGSAAWDTEAYSVTYVDPTHMTLDRPYNGTTGSGKGWIAGAPGVGHVVQPFMEALACDEMERSARILDGVNNTARDVYRAISNKCNDWLLLTVRANHGALYFYGTSCANSTMCYYGDAADAEADKVLGLEFISSWGDNYQRTANASYKAAADDMATGQWCKTGTGCTLTPGADYFASWNYPGGFYYTYSNLLGDKWLGQNFGHPRALISWIVQRIPPTTSHTAIGPLNFIGPITILP